MKILHGCTIEPIQGDRCHALVAWVTGAGEPPDHLPVEVSWLLAHTTEGVVWGHRRDGTWPLSGHDDAFPEVSPPLEEGTLEELRLFGADGEALVWRSPHGLTGRWLVHAADQTGVPEWCRPLPDTRVLLGDPLPGRASTTGFTLVQDAKGSRQAVPLPPPAGGHGGRGWPYRLHLVHYLEEDAPDPGRADDDQATGAVRIAATRLSALTSEPA